VLSLAAFPTLTANAADEPNYPDGGFGYIGGHVNVDPNSSNGLTVQIPLEFFADPADWFNIMGFRLQLDFVDHIAFLKWRTAVSDSDGDIVGLTTAKVIGGAANGQYEITGSTNAPFTTSEVDPITGYLDGCKVQFQITDMEAFKAALLASPDHLLHIRLSYLVDYRTNNIDAAVLPVGNHTVDDIIFVKNLNYAALTKFVDLTLGISSKVSFDVSGTDTPDSIPDQNVEYGDHATEPTTDPTKSGGEFDYWYVQGGDPDTPFDFDTDIITGDIVLVPHFKSLECTLDFNPNHDGLGSAKSETFNSGDSVVVGNYAPALTRTGYVLIGWSETPEAAVVTQEDFDAVNFLDTFTISGDKTIYAVWATDTKNAYEPGEDPYDPDTDDGIPDYLQVTITYAQNPLLPYLSGSVPSKVVVNKGSNYVVSANSGLLKYTDAVFMGWSLSKRAVITTAAEYNGGTNIYFPGFEITNVQSDITLYPVAGEDKVNGYDPDGGDGPYDENNPYDPDKGDEIPDFLETKLIFDDGTANIPAIQGNPPATVYFPPNYAGPNFPLPGKGGLTLVDAVFLGWSKTDPAKVITSQAEEDAAGIITVITPADLTNGDVTLYPVWAEDKDHTGHKDYDEFTVSFNLNGANTPASVPSQIVISGEKATDPNVTPTRDGFVFDGWATKNGSVYTPFDFNTPITEDLVLYATWKDITVEIVPADSNGTALGGLTILRGHWANEYTATLKFLVRVNGSGSPAEFAKEASRFALTATPANGFETVGKFASYDEILTASSLSTLTTAGTVQYDGKEYCVVTVNVTDVKNSGIVDFVLTYTASSGAKTASTHKVIIPGAVLKNTTISTADYAMQYNYLRGSIETPLPLADGNYVYELANLDGFPDITTADYSIMYGLLRGSLKIEA
jgi:uncharacterized repeat protein (TIGR02543 family)